MTNEQMWTMYETFKSIARMARDKEEIIAELDRIIESCRTTLPKNQSKS